MRVNDLKSNNDIYVDLDGVLADLEGYIKDLGIDIKPTPSGDWENADAIWKKLRAMNQPDFSELDLLPDAMKLWNYVRPYNPNILTATGHPAAKNDAEKRQWVKKHLTGYKSIYTVVTSHNKAKFAWPDAILIDDRMKSIQPWRDSGGIGIVHTSAENTIQELKKLGL